MRYRPTHHTPKLNTTYEMANGCRHTIMGFRVGTLEWTKPGFIIENDKFEVIQHGRPSMIKIDADKWHNEPKRKLTLIQKGKLTKRSRQALKRNLDFNEWFISEEDRVLLAMASKEFRAIEKERNPASYHQGLVDHLDKKSKIEPMFDNVDNGCISDTVPKPKPHQVFFDHVAKGLSNKSGTVTRLPPKPS